MHRIFMDNVLITLHIIISYIVDYILYIYIIFQTQSYVIILYDINNTF